MLHIIGNSVILILVTKNNASFTNYKICLWRDISLSCMQLLCCILNCVCSNMNKKKTHKKLNYDVYRDKNKLFWMNIRYDQK